MFDSYVGSVTQLRLCTNKNKTQSDYSRAQHTEKYIQERVLAELATLEADAGTRFRNAVDASLLGSDDSKLSVSESDGKITSLTKVLKENIALAKVEVPPAAKEAREAVIACLKENSGKPLNCWEEVNQFKKLTKDL